MNYLNLIAQDDPITEEWLKAVGFRWHQFDRQPDKHWLLWLGLALEDRVTSMEDLGVEVAPGYDGKWYCWLRSDSCYRYHRFIHVRHIRLRGELVQILEGLTGVAWKPENNCYGMMHTDGQMAIIQREQSRLDQWLLNANPRWSDLELDDSRGRPLPEHMAKAEGLKDR